MDGKGAHYICYPIGGSTEFSQIGDNKESTSQTNLFGNGLLRRRIGIVVLAPSQQSEREGLLVRSFINQKNAEVDPPENENQAKTTLADPGV